MSLTREFLRELAVCEEAVDRILSAHESALGEVAAQRDQHAAAVQQLEADFAAYRSTAEEERTMHARGEVLSGALRRAGANEAAVPLLTRLFCTGDGWNGTALTDEEAFIARVRHDHEGLFTTRQALPTAIVAPPLSVSGPLSLDDLRRMKPDEINRQWPLVRTALKNP